MREWVFEGVIHILVYCWMMCMAEFNIIDEIISKKFSCHGRGPRSGSIRREFGPNEGLC